jgi:Tfp pilus assembly protein PilN
MQAEVARLNSYEQFEKLAEARAATVREIASSRFDWHGALSDLSKVVPSNTSLQSLVATVSSTASSGGSSAGSGGAVRSAIDAPAFELKGCTGTQDEVAQLMSRLRLINGVTRVTLEDSSKGSAGAPGTQVSSAGPSGAGCPANGPTFDMVVFFQPVAGSLLPSAGATTTPGGAK